MLRNVQQIQVGDKIQLTTPWETLIYRVSELKIIDPSDINAVLIQPGRDLLTFHLPPLHPQQPALPGNCGARHRRCGHHQRGGFAGKRRYLGRNAAPGDRGGCRRQLHCRSGPPGPDPLPGEGSAESEGSAISNTMIWLENNALWAGLVVIAAAVGIMVIWKKHRED